jgi:hypothetical protein
MSAPITRIGIALISALLLAASVFAAYRLIVEMRTLQTLQQQRAELEHVKYGLLNAEVWVDRIATILADRVQDFELTTDNRPEIKRNVELVLDRLLQEIEQALRRRNAQGSSWLDRLQGSLRQGVQDWLVDFESLRARVPLYADAVLDELDRPETRARIRRALIETIDDAAEQTFSRVDQARLRAIEAAHGCPSPATCAAQIDAEAAARQRRAQHAALWALAGIGLVLALNLPARGPAGRDAARRPRRSAAVLHPEAMALLSAATLVLLATGVATPMIEVEARIDRLSLTLLGEPVSFSNQVLYFQSKSILDVAQVLVATGAADMLVVAALLVLFSLIFPAAKTLTGALYYADIDGLGRHSLVRFFALRSGKWSMADVLVVAIFMAYIGFDGLIASQLAGLNGSGPRVDVITTNGTRLQLGFYMFLAFVLSSLLLSTRLEGLTTNRDARR